MWKKIIIVIAILLVGPFLGYEAFYLFYSFRVPEWSNPHKQKPLPEKVIKVFAKRFGIRDKIEFERIGTTNVLYEMYDARINYKRKSSYTYPSTSKGALLAHDVTNSLFSGQERKVSIHSHGSQRFRYFNSVWISRNWKAEDALKYIIFNSSYGVETYGITDAAKKYFNKAVRDLSQEEAAFLAATTVTYNVQTSPWCNPEYLYFYINKLKLLDKEVTALPASTTKPDASAQCNKSNQPKVLPPYIRY